jgi:hypothetical protein
MLRNKDETVFRADVNPISLATKDKSSKPIFSEGKRNKVMMLAKDSQISQYPIYEQNLIVMTELSQKLN